MNKILIIGGSIAGLSAAVNARLKDSEAQISIITKELHNPYRRPAIPSVITGEVANLDDISIFIPQYLKQQKIDYWPGIEAINLDLKTKAVKIRRVTSNKIDMLEYDKLILCMGGYPWIPKIEGVDKNGVCTFTTYDDALDIIKITKSGSSAVVIGAGFIGLEIAESLMKRGVKVYLNVRSRILRRLLEPDFSAYLDRYFENRGLKILKGESISEIGGKKDVEYVVMKGKKIETSLVVFGIGVRPNIGIAKDAGIELGKTGAIKVNTQMQTSEKDVYAAGDCAESLDLLTKRYVYSPVGSIAALTGAIAGANAAGENQETEGFIRAQVDEILGQEIISIGHSSTTAKEVNLDIRIYDLEEILKYKEDLTLSKKYPVKIKILTDTTNKIIGAQIITPRYGSQYSYEFFNAILEHKSFDEFISGWKPQFEKIINVIKNKQKISAVEKYIKDIGLVKW